MVPPRLRQLIMEKFGEEYIEEAKKRLCGVCIGGGSCPLLPITSDGADCPYFGKKQ